MKIKEFLLSIPWAFCGCCFILGMCISRIGRLENEAKEMKHRIEKLEDKNGR